MKKRIKLLKQNIKENKYNTEEVRIAMYEIIELEQKIEKRN